MLDIKKQREAIAKYPDEIIDDVLYIAQVLEEKYAGNIGDLAADLKRVELSRSKNWFTQLLGGYYMRNGVFTAGTGTVAAMAKALRDIASGNAVSGLIPFTETDAVRLVRSAIDAARFRGNVCKWVLVVGPTGSQKTQSVENYADTHDDCVYIEAPDKSSLQEFLRRLALKMRCPSNVNKRQYLEDSVRENFVILIDNAQRLYDEKRGLTQPCFSFLQTLQDSTKCTIVLVFVDEATGEDSLSRIMLGKDKGYFEQLIGRAGGIDRIVRMPTVPSDTDLLTFAKSAGFKDAGLRKSILPILRGLSKRDGKIRIPLKVLQDAARAAFVQNRDIEIDDFLNVLPLESFNDKQLLYIDSLKQKALPCA